MQKHIDIFNSLNKREKELILQVIKYQRISKNELASLLRLKSATLYRMIDYLSSLNVLLVSKNTENSTVGRPRDIVECNPGFGAFFIINVRRYSYHTALADFSGRIINMDSHEINSTVSPYQLKMDCLQAYNSYLKTSQLSDKDIIAVLVDSFGRFYEKAEDRTDKHYQYPGFSWNNDSDIPTFFGDVFSAPIYSSNAAPSCACELYYSRFFPEYKNLAYIIMDEGIGIGYIIDKQPPRESMRNVNGLGHMIVDIHGEKCACGQYGCLETIASDYSIIKQARNLLKVRKQGLLYDLIDNLTIETISAAADNGDEIAKEVLAYAASALAIGIGNLLRIFNLEIIILSGKLFYNSNFFLQILRETLSTEQGLQVCADESPYLSGIKGALKSYIFTMLE